MGRDLRGALFAAERDRAAADLPDGRCAAMRHRGSCLRSFTVVVSASHTASPPSEARLGAPRWRGRPISSAPRYRRPAGEWTRSGRAYLTLVPTAVTAFASTT
jgi:hypothetical protein